MEILGFLPLPKQLPLAIHAFFQPDYSPTAKFAPGGAAAAQSPVPLQQPSAMLAPPPSASSPHSANDSNGSTLPYSRSANALSAPPSSSSPFAGGASSSSSSSSSSSLMPAPPGGSPSASASASAASASASAFELDLAAMEGGAKSEGGNGGPNIGEGNGDNDHEFSVSRSGEGMDGSSSDQDDSGSDDSALRGDEADDHDPSALPVDGRKAKKKRARHSSLVALSKAVDHVCASATRDEAVISSLQNILRGAMSKAGRHTQNTLRALLQKLQDKQGSAGNADDLAPAMKSMSLGAGADEQKSSAPAPVSASASSSSSSSLALTSSALSPSAFASPPASLSPSAFHFTCGICHGAQDKPVALECGHEFCRSCLSSFLNSLVGAKKAVGIKCPFKPLGSASSSSVAAPSACSHELSTGVIQQVLSPADFESYLNATLMSFIESDDCLTVTCPNPTCHNIMSIEPLVNPQVPAVITEKDEDGKLLTKETYLHFLEFRVRSVRKITTRSVSSILFPALHERSL